MKKMLLFILFLSGYANASFNGEYFCQDETRVGYFKIEIGPNITHSATIEIMSKNKKILIKDAIMFDYTQDRSFNLKTYKQGQLTLINFSLNKDTLTVKNDGAEGDTTVCERVIVLQQ